MRFGILAAIVLVCADAGAWQPLTIDRVSWLQGCWRSSQGQATVEEQWMAPRGGTMIGMSRTVRGGETTAHEFILIDAQGGNLAYRAQPSGQPAATFPAKTVSNASVVFENPEHDFPQRIGYRRDGADGLQAWVEGLSKGQTRRIDFSYRRVRCETP